MIFFQLMGQYDYFEPSEFAIFVSMGKWRGAGTVEFSTLFSKSFKRFGHLSDTVNR